MHKAKFSHKGCFLDLNLEVGLWRSVTRMSCLTNGEANFGTSQPSNLFKVAPVPAPSFSHLVKGVLCSAEAAHNLCSHSGVCAGPQFVTSVHNDLVVYGRRHRLCGRLKKVECMGTNEFCCWCVKWP